MAHTLAQVDRTTLQNAVAVTGNGNSMLIQTGNGGYSLGAFQVTGTFVATVTFECTIDGSTWVALECISAGNSATVSTTAAAAGVWRFVALGYYAVRARVTWTSGTSVTVWCSVSA